MNFTFFYFTELHWRHIAFRFRNKVYMLDWCGMLGARTPPFLWLYSGRRYSLPVSEDRCTDWQSSTIRKNSTGEQIYRTADSENAVRNNKTASGSGIYRSDRRSDQIRHAVELRSAGILQANIQWDTVVVTLFHTAAYSSRYTDTLRAEVVPRLVSLWGGSRMIGAYAPFACCSPGRRTCIDSGTVSMAEKNRLSDAKQSNPLLSWLTDWIPNNIWLTYSRSPPER